MIFSNETRNKINMKIEFLDEYSVCGRNLESITRQGEYTGYDTTSHDEVLSHCEGAEV